MSSSADSSGNNGGGTDSNSTDLKSLLLFGVAYVAATTIAVKAFDRFSSEKRKENKTAKSGIPKYCEYILDFHKDCLNVTSYCDGYNELIKTCHEAGVASGSGATVSHPHLDHELLLNSYSGCRSRPIEWPWGAPCKKYTEYMKKTNAVLQ